VERNHRVSPRRVRLREGFLIAMGALALVAGPAWAAEPAEAVADDIVAAIRSLPDSDVFATAVEQFNIASHLQPGALYTVFVPTDAAFQRAEVSLESAEAVLAYFVEGTYTFGELVEQVERADGDVPTLTSLAGDEIELLPRQDNEVSLNGVATITSPESRIENLTIFVLDDVLEPVATTAD
jgi:uncharacterized surface protein with fasciclin (FAS1) repeats